MRVFAGGSRAFLPLCSESPPSPTPEFVVLSWGWGLGGGRRWWTGGRCLLTPLLHRSMRSLPWIILRHDWDTEPTRPVRVHANGRAWGNSLGGENMSRCVEVIAVTGRKDGSVMFPVDLESGIRHWRAAPAIVIGRHAGNLETPVFVVVGHGTLTGAALGRRAFTGLYISQAFVWSAIN